MRQILMNSALALLMATGATLAIPNAANAQISLELDENGPKVRVDRCDPSIDDCSLSRREREEMRREEERREMRRDERRDDRREERRADRGCTEDRALQKAERMGIRRARIEDSDRRSIDVRGRSRGGDRILVTFGRQSGCPVLR